MRAGPMSHRVTLKSPTRARDSFNEMVTTWTEEAKVYGEFVNQAGRLFHEAQQNNSEVHGILRIRYRSDIQAEWRFTYESRTFQIISLVNIGERDRELLIYYKEALD